MKKRIALIMLFSGLLTTNVNAELIMNYYEENVTTASEGYRFDGKSDPNYPLYINDKEVKTSENGYFSEYVPLKEGENIIVIDNTTDKKTATITKYTPQKGEKASEDAFKKVDLVGRVILKSPTVRSLPDEGDYDLVTPYTENTLIKIIGENSEYYKTKNSRYIYKEAVEIVKDFDYAQNNVSEVSFDNDNAIHISMDRPTEYNAELGEDFLKIELFDTNSSNKKINLNKKIFRNVSCKNYGGRTIYQFNFAEKKKYIGFFASFDEKGMNIKLNEKSQSKKGSLEGINIIVDSGHGGTDSGALGLGDIHEKTIALNIAENLKNYLQEKGANVIMTRSDDTFVALADRTETTIANMPDAFVSIHCDSLPLTSDAMKRSGMSGLYTFDTPSSFVECLKESIPLNRVAKQNLAVTRNTVCPSVLIETGIMANYDEYEYLIKEENQKTVAEKIGAGLEKYFSEM